MKGLDRLVDMSRYRPHLDIQPEPHPRAEHGRLDAQPDSGEERSSRRTCLGEQLDGGTDTDGPLDANLRRFTELDLEVVIVRQRRSDDLFLHLTVERDVQFLAYVVLSQVDQRVLLGELGERDVQRALVGGATGSDDRFQGWRGEMVALRGRPRFADRVPDPNFPETPEPADSSRGDRRSLDGRATLEYAYSGDLPLLVPVESQKIPHPYRPREHTDVRDLLSCRSSFDLEDHARDRAIDIASGRWQQLRDAEDQLIHARARDRRAEEHRMHQRLPGLRRKLAAESAVRDRGLVVDVGGKKRVVVVGEQIDQSGSKVGVGGTVRRETGTAGSQPAGRSHRDDRRRQSLGDAPQQAFTLRAAVDLVHEDEGRNAQPL